MIRWLLRHETNERGPWLGNSLGHDTLFVSQVISESSVGFTLPPLVIPHGSSHPRFDPHGHRPAPWVLSKLRWFVRLINKKQTHLDRTTHPIWIHLDRTRPVWIEHTPFGSNNHFLSGGL